MPDFDSPLWRKALAAKAKIRRVFGSGTIKMYPEGIITSTTALTQEEREALVEEWRATYIGIHPSECEVTILPDVPPPPPPETEHRTP